MFDKELYIYVEGPTDSVIVEYIFKAAGLDVDGIKIIQCGGKQQVKSTISSLRNSDRRKYIALVDADKVSVADSVAEARLQLGNPSISVFCAVPTIEAWIFADNDISPDVTRGEHATAILNRVALPESIAYPKQLAANVFPRGEPREIYRFLTSMNYRKAAARSPSLRHFLSAVAKIVEKEADFDAMVIGASVNRDIISTLLRELPGDKIAWSTLASGPIHAEDLAQAVQEGSEIGRQYATELLRTARDLIVRKASSR